MSRQQDRISKLESGFKVARFVGGPSNGEFYSCAPHNELPQVFRVYIYRDLSYLVDFDTLYARHGDRAHDFKTIDYQLHRLRLPTDTPDKTKVMYLYGPIGASLYEVMIKLLFREEPPC